MTGTRRICLITPRHLYANPRLVKEATALTAAGYDVTVICGQYAPRLGAHDASLIDPRWRLKQVRFGPFEASPLHYIQQTLRRHVARAVAGAGYDGVEIAQTAHAAAVPELIAAAKSEEADLYVAHYVAALPAAAKAGQLFGKPCAFDAEDFHQGELLTGHATQNLDCRLIRRIESCYLPQTAYVSAASPLIANAYADTYHIIRPDVILNTFPPARITSAPGRAFAPHRSVYWFSQTIGPHRGLETAVSAIALAKAGPHLYLRGTPAPGFAEKLRFLADQQGVGDRLHLLPPAAPSALERLGSQFDIGYSGESGFSVNNMLALGNKLFSYLCSGLPIIASDTAAHVDIAPEFGSAMSLFRMNDAQSLALGLDAMLLDSSRLEHSRASARELYAKRFNWDHDKHVFLGLVSSALSDVRVTKHA